MTETFRGEFNQKVDAKARVSIPAAFRRVLEAGDPAWRDTSRLRFVMVYGDVRRKFAECYPILEMRKLEVRIARLPVGSDAHRMLVRNFLTQSLVVEVDDDGRIVLPGKIREKIGMADAATGGEAVFAGALGTFQLWRAEDYDSAMAAMDALELAHVPEMSDMLSLLPPDPVEA